MLVNRTRVTEVPYATESWLQFEAFANDPWCVFLDSGRPWDQRGRYDIIASDPFVTLCTQGLYTEIATRDGQSVCEGDPIGLLKHYLGSTSESDLRLPFTGGAIGYFAYDLGRRLERIPSLAEQDIPMPEMAFGVYDWALVVDHQCRRTWLCGQGRDARTFDEWEALLERSHKKRNAVLRVPFETLSAVNCNFDRAAYGEAFRRVKRYIREGDCYQVNLAQRFSARARGDAWLAYRQLRSLNPAPFSAFLRTPGGAVLSSSPERFLHVTKGLVETKPIKGTRPRSIDHGRDRALREELRHSPKDRAENLMIVDLLRNDLGKTCAIGSIKVPKLFALESYATVHHLVSTITGRLDLGKHALDLLAGCFPGGSITGAPKLRAMEIIEQLEPHRRSAYCGAIGYIGFDGRMDTNIAIRTLVYCEGFIHAWAGGGIVADSGEEAEYQETLDKAVALLKLMQSQNLSHVGS
ncbi:MAG: aminodeoxychorismate synthase component I [Gammaproteobacteria bacterium]